MTLCPVRYFVSPILMIRNCGSVAQISKLSNFCTINQRQNEDFGSGFSIFKSQCFLLLHTVNNYHLSGGPGNHQSSEKGGLLQIITRVPRHWLGPTAQPASHILVWLKDLTLKPCWSRFGSSPTLSSMNYKCKPWT